jgi:signal transduction histidine kinase
VPWLGADDQAIGHALQPGPAVRALQRKAGPSSDTSNTQVVGLGSMETFALSLVATAVVAVAFQPLRERLQPLANRLVYGKRLSPYEVLAEFSRRLVGDIAVSKPPGEPLTATDQALLADLAAQAGPALGNVPLAADLRVQAEEQGARRRRIVAAQDQERRRIERDLHDAANEQRPVVSW